MNRAFPDMPSPTEVELEITSNCNAACVACPRDDMPHAGRMTPQTLDRILDIYDETRAAHPLNKRLGGLRYPWVTFAGGGDPLMHPNATGFMRRCRDRGYELLVITNAAALTPARAEEFLDTGVSTISCSFWGIGQDEYEAAMKLSYHRSLRNVLLLARGAAARGVRLSVSWVRVPEVRSSTEQIAAFWAGYGIEVDTTDNYMWNRAGLLQIPPELTDPEVVRVPDAGRQLWCADLYFTDAWSWDGRCMLCSCNFFHRIPYVVGDVTNSGAEIAEAKKQLLSDRPIPRMCRTCLQPRSLQSVWLAEPWRPLVDQREWQLATYAAPAAVQAP